MKEYLDFEIRMVARQPEGYAVYVDGPGGQAEGVFALPVYDAQFRALEEQLQRLEIDEAGIEALGQRLFQELFQGPVKEALIRSRSRLHEGQGLRMRFNIALTEAKLAALPWEFLTDPDDIGPLAMLDTPIVRFLPQPTPIPRLQTQLPLRVLLTAAQTPPLVDVQRELTAVQEALQGAHITVHVEEHLTSGKLQRLLRDEFHIWHFIGHGGFSGDGKTGRLHFEDPTGDEDPVSATQLGIMLNRSSVRLIVLDACKSGQIAIEPLRSMAPTLIRAQIPAVVAMQFTVPTESTRAFAGEFYAALAKGLPIDACVTEGRRAVMGVVGLRRPDWGIPVVYTRAPDGKLFDLPAPPTAPTGGTSVTIGGQISNSDIQISEVGTIIKGTPPGDLEEREEERQALRQQIRAKKRRLHERKLQQSMMGLTTDPSISMEIEDLEKEIAALEHRLRQLDQEEQ